MFFCIRYLIAVIVGVVVMNSSPVVPVTDDTVVEWVKIYKETMTSGVQQRTGNSQWLWALLPSLHEWY